MSNLLRACVQLCLMESVVNPEKPTRRDYQALNRVSELWNETWVCKDEGITYLRF